jgi:hypothetical protein
VPYHHVTDTVALRDVFARTVAEKCPVVIEVTVGWEHTQPSLVARRAVMEEAFAQVSI